VEDGAEIRIVAARAPLARLQVFSAAGALLLVCAIFAGGYGYHRDELYFRMLPPAWGYVDQPPLTPAAVRVVSTVADEVWAIRAPAALLGALSVVVIGLVVAELGGRLWAQALAAWGYAFGTMTLTFSHVMLTASFDLVIWPAVMLTVIRVVRRGDRRWWLPAGLLAGLSTYNKWLIVMLALGLVIGLIAAGPRQVLRSRWLLAAIGLALLVALTNVAWQIQHGCRSWLSVRVCRSRMAPRCGSACGRSYW
jgi:4-amino-4-deoxy-L-arabinose transferase-like glycosyltransferase